MCAFGDVNDVSFIELYCLRKRNSRIQLVFQLTVRIATCKELAEDKQVISRLAQHYWDIEQSATPASALFPWFPTPAKRLKQRATMALYTTVLSYVNVRRKASTPSISPIDIFISQGTSDDVIVGVSLVNRSRCVPIFFQ